MEESRKLHTVQMYGFCLAQIRNSFTRPLLCLFAGFRERAKGQRGQFSQEQRLPAQCLLQWTAGSRKACRKRLQLEPQPLGQDGGPNQGPKNRSPRQVRSRPLAPMWKALLSREGNSCVLDYQRLKKDLGPAQLGRKLRIEVEGSIIRYVRPITSCNCQDDLFKKLPSVLKGRKERQIKGYILRIPKC